MRDCPNATMRDRLPDLLSGRLPAGEQADVRAHVAACVDCRAELELLERVLASAVTPRVDTTRIVAALPAYRPASWWRAAGRSRQAGIAAALVLLAGTATLIAGRVVGGPPLVPDPVASASVQVPTRGATSVRETPEPSLGRDALAYRPTELAVGETLQDLSDADLRELLDELERFEALMPAEPEAIPPSLGRGAG